MDIWTYYELLLNVLLVLKNNLVVVLQIPLNDKSITMLIYTVYDVVILHPQLNTVLQYNIAGDY